MKKFNYCLFLLFSLLFFGCKSSQNKSIITTKEVKNDNRALLELVSIMQGHYTSEAHSKRDTTYYDITLRMTPIWKKKGNFLFVEQAMTKKTEKPYRVRIYKISQRSENEFVSEIFTIKNEKNWIGKWNTPEAYNSLLESDLELKSGCEVVLKRIGLNKFSGSTGIKICPSELRGATYATSKVNVYEDKIVSWDQGFDKNDKQVWGALKSGYDFIKVK